MRSTKNETLAYALCALAAVVVAVALFAPSPAESSAYCASDADCKAPTPTCQVWPGGPPGTVECQSALGTCEPGPSFCDDALYLCGCDGAWKTECDAFGGALVRPPFGLGSPHAPPSDSGRDGGAGWYYDAGPPVPIPNCPGCNLCPPGQRSVTEYAQFGDLAGYACVDVDTSSCTPFVCVNGDPYDGDNDGCTDGCMPRQAAGCPTAFCCPGLAFDPDTGAFLGGASIDGNGCWICGE